MQEIANDLNNNSSISIPKHTKTMLHWDMITIIKSISYDIDNQNIPIEFHATEEVEHFFNPKDEKGYDLDFVRNLNFANTMKQIAIYNICRNDLVRGETSNISIEELKKLTKTPDNKYKTIGNFISRVIKSQVDYINKKSLIDIEYKTVKTGRKVTAIKFFVRKKINTHYTK